MKHIIFPNTGIVNITCIGSRGKGWGCDNGKVNASNVGELYVYARELGSYDMDIYGQNILSTFEITAIGTITNYTASGLKYADIYIPALDADLDKFSLNCYGAGCYSLTFNKEGGFDNISNADLNFNGCYQCQDDSMF